MPVAVRPAIAPAPPGAERRIVSEMGAAGSISHIGKLAAAPRVTDTEAFRAAAEYVVETAQRHGWDARIEPAVVTAASGVQDARSGAGMVAGPYLNVVAERRGSAPDGQRGVVVAGAHLDSVPRSPGGNDNASGSGMLLEATRVLAQHPTRDDYRFLWFDAEERGLLGSAAYVRQHRDELPNMRVMLNADMVASPHGTPGISLGLRTHEALATRVLDAAKRNDVPLDQFPERHARSDHASFDAAGVPAVDFGVSVRTVGRDDPNYHSPRDTAQNVNPALLESFGDAFALAAYDFANGDPHVPRTRS